MKRFLLVPVAVAAVAVITSCQSENAGKAVPPPEVPLNHRLEKTYGWQGGRVLPEGVRGYQPPENRQTAVSAAPDETYTVVKGDSLWSIAARKYGDGHKWPVLLDANNAVLKGNPEKLKEGMVLVIPPAPAK